MADPTDDDDPLKKMQRRLAEAGKAITATDKVVPLRPKAEAKEARRRERETHAKERERGKTFKPYPPEGPVSCLGVQGSDYYFLDAIRQLIIKPSEKLGTKGIDDLFKQPEAQRWAEQSFPRLSMWGDVIGIDRDRLSRALVAECGSQGVFNPDGRVRGPGAWQNDHGHLVFHAGDALLTYDQNGRQFETQPGIIDSHIYPTGDVQMRPFKEDCDHKPAEELLEILKTWHWRRGELDALLLLGWIVLAPIAGALRWRPAAWITGDAATGKSTLQQHVIRHTQGGPNGLLQAADATGAGIWQTLEFSARPVALDEIEAEANNEKKETIVRLMRISSSGDQLVRGGATHKGVRFNAYSTFLFSSINMLALQPQDMSRLAVLELLPLARGSQRPNLDPVKLARIGAQLRRRVIMAWPRLDEHLAPWCLPIEKEFDRRTGDTFGFLLAFADLALHRDPPGDSDSVDQVLGPLLPSLREWKAVAGRDDELMLNHLATWQLEPWERRRMMVRQLVYWASVRPDTPTDQNEQQRRYGETVPAAKAEEALRRHGLAVVKSRSGPAPGSEYLAIANRHAQLERIFRATKWQSGVWRQSASRVPGAISQNKVRFGERPEGAVMLPIAAMLGDVAADSADLDSPGP